MKSLVDALLEDGDQLALRIGDEIRARLPSYEAADDAGLVDSIRLEVECTLAAARTGSERIVERRLAQISEVGQARAREGIPIDETLLGWRIGVWAVMRHARELAPGLGIEPAETLEFVEALLAASDRAMVIVADGHRGAELELARQEQQGATEFVVAVLEGRLSPSEARSRAQARGLDPGAEYVAVRAHLPDGSSRRQLERTLGFADTVAPRRGLATVVDGDLAGLLRTPPELELDVAVGIGPARRLDRLPESFNRATRALTTARAFRLVGAKSTDELGLLPAVVADADVGDALCRRYLDPLAGSRAEIADSLRALFDCDLQVERAAERLFVHPNTLRYRMARFEELTGARLRDHTTALEVWWALQRDRVRSGD